MWQTIPYGPIYLLILKIISFIFGCASLCRCLDFLQLWQAGAALQLWRKGCSLLWFLLMQSMGSGRVGLGSCCTRAQELPFLKHRLWSTGSIAAAHGFSCSVACGNFPDQGLNLHLLHLLHWQVSCLPLVPPGKLIITHKNLQLHAIILSKSLLSHPRSNRQITLLLYFFLVFYTGTLQQKMSQEMGIKLQAISFFSSVQIWTRGFMNAEFLKNYSKIPQNIY